MPSSRCLPKGRDRRGESHVQSSVLRQTIGWNDMHLGGRMMAGFVTSMQNSPVANLPSLSSTHPINGKTQVQSIRNEALGVASLPPRSARRNGNLADAANSQKAAQAAKQEIRTKLREDWTWTADSQASCLDQQQNLPESDSAWHERGSDSSYTNVDATPDPYQYESPDAFAQPLMWKKRRKVQMLQDEMAWNKGLRHYEEQRNAWSGARVQLPPSTSSVRIRGSSSTTSSPYDDGPDVTSPSCLADEPLSESVSTSPLPTTLIPLAPPILSPDNAVRGAITLATYPSIYSKIVIQGLSPTVPINLSDVVGSLVEGWKADGEWPPKSEAERMAELNGGLDGEFGGVRDGGKRLAKKGIGRLKRVLGVGNGHDSSPSGVDVTGQAND